MVIIIYSTFYSMLFLEDKPKIQEPCANTQLTMAVHNCTGLLNFVLVILVPGNFSKNLQSEETTAFRHGS